MAYLPILTYHRLLAGTPTRQADPQRISVSQDQFRRQLTWLKRLGYRTVRLEDYAAALRGGATGMGPRTFAITFDDGYQEVLSLALPVLEETGFTAAVFAVPGQLGGTNAWDDGRARLLTAEELRRLDQAGITIGSHTCRHVHLPKVAPDIARKELADSKGLLEEILGHPVTLLAYPYGESDPAVERMAEDAGYLAAFATDRAPRDHAENVYRIRRPVVFPKNTAWDILVKAQRWYPAYQDWKR